MLAFEEKVKRDRNLCREARIKALARVIGYNETGEPVEIVYTYSTGIYTIQVAGEEMKEASPDVIEQFLQ